MVFVGASDQMHAVGEQRGSERIAGKAGVAPPVEAEAEGTAAVDATAEALAE